MGFDNIRDVMNYVNDWPPERAAYEAEREIKNLLEDSYATNLTPEEIDALSEILPILQKVYE